MSANLFNKVRMFVKTTWQDNNMTWRKLVLILAIIFAAGGFIPFCWTIISAWIEILSK